MAAAERHAVRAVVDVQPVQRCAEPRPRHVRVLLPGLRLHAGGRASLTRPTSEVGLTSQLPTASAADPNDMDDPYAVFIHGFNTVGGATANGVMFDWTVIDARRQPDGGPASASATLGARLRLSTWSGPAFATGPGRESRLGACPTAMRGGVQGLDDRQDRERRGRRLLRPGGLRPVTGLHCRSASGAVRSQDRAAFSWRTATP